MNNYCVRCGACKAGCPTYDAGAAEGLGARGRIVLLDKFFRGEIGHSKTLDERIFSCMICGACNSLCPLGINVTDEIYKYRKAAWRLDRKRKLVGLGAGFIFKRMSAGFKILKFLEMVNEVLPVYRLRPFRILNELGIGSLGLPLRDGASIFKVPRPIGRIAVFTGCTVNYLSPRIGMSLIRGLNAMSYDVVLPKGETCCAAPLLGLGLEEDAAQLAEKNMKTFSRMNVEAVVGLCPTCIHFIKNEYKRLVGDGIENAVEVSQFFSDKLQVMSNKLKKKDQSLVNRNSSLKTIYHDPCHSVYSLNVKSEPRDILKSMGFDLIHSEGGCCGFGGSFKLLYRDMSGDILQKRVEEYKKADMIVTSCPNCMLQLRGKMKDKRIRHIIEIIEEEIVEKT